MAIGLKITGTGSAFPPEVLTNEGLVAKLALRGLETNVDWIQTRTGISERRISRPGVEADRNSSLAVVAATRALEMAGKRPEDIDQILFATCTPDTLIPSTACWLQQKLGAHRAWAMDLNAACSGFVYGLATANQFIATGSVKTSLVVGGDILSVFTNWDDRGSCILFGDGVGAVLVEAAPSDSDSTVLSTVLRSDGSLWDLFHIVSGGSNQETTPDAHTQKLDKMQMKGVDIFKAAVRTLAECAEETVKSAGLTLSEIDWFIPHQANIRIIDAVGKRLNIEKSKVLVNIDRSGNTSSATAPTALDEAVRSKKIKRGDLILLDVFGAGLTSGAMLLRW